MGECKNSWLWEGFCGRTEEKISCGAKDWWYFEIAHCEAQLLLCISMPGNTLFPSIQLPGKLNRRLLLFQGSEWKIRVLVCCSRVNLQEVSGTGCWTRLKSAQGTLLFLSKAAQGWFSKQDELQWMCAPLTLPAVWRDRSWMCRFYSVKHSSASVKGVAKTSLGWVLFCC